jgi:predicted permease
VIGRDLKFAFRQLTKSPGYAVAVMLTLALGIGVNTAVFSIADGFLLRSLPFREPARVAALIFHLQGVSKRDGQYFSEDDDTHTGATWLALKESLHSVRLASWGGTDGVNLQTDAASGKAVRYVHETRVSADYFGVLGLPLYRGRGFTAQEDAPKGPNAVVLSYRLWQSSFGANPNVVGQAIHLKGEPYTVVGVLPEGAVTPSKAELFTPLRPAPTGECGSSNCGILLRLEPGATWQQAEAELTRVHLPMMDEFSGLDRGGAWFYVQPFARYLSGDMRPQVEVLMLAVSFILLIACANLAGLALVRIARRTREIATRLALGATRMEVLRQLWIENLVLAVLGAAAGVALAIAILRGLGGFLPEYMLPMGGFAVNSRELVFAVAASLATSLMFGALPALTTRRVDLRSSMSGSYSVAGGSGRLRQWLIGAEVALTVVLLAAAGLLVRTLIHLETLPPGFDAANVMTAKASLDDARYHDAAAFQGLMAKSVEAMRRIPGVEDAAVGLSAPYDRGLNDGITIMDGEQTSKRAGSSLSYVTPSYFSTLRIPLLAGRSVVDGDTSTSQLISWQE